MASVPAPPLATTLVFPVRAKPEFGEDRRRARARSARSTGELGQLRTGSLCGTEEDFFVLNEEARDGDSVEYTIKASGGGTVEVRLYDELPCEFDEPGTIKTCAKLRQFYPTTNPDGTTPPAFDPPLTAKADFPHKNGNRPVFVGLRIKQGLGSCVASYTLEVLLNRDSGSVYK